MVIACEQRPFGQLPQASSNYSAARHQTIIEEPSEEPRYVGHEEEEPATKTTATIPVNDVPPAGGTMQPQGGPGFPPIATDDDLIGDGYFGPPLVAPYAKCGDGIKQPLEECDDTDKNTINTDGCNILCSKPYCGNGVTEKNEACDDGNDEDGDGCSKRCQFERCGNSVLDPGEECDDGNLTDGDKCSACCLFETTRLAINHASKDEVIASPKEDPKLASKPSLQALTIAPHYGPDEPFEDDFEGPITGFPAPYPVCGNGIVEPTEQCDDANEDNDDGCNVICLFPICGNGVLELYEECDDNDNDDSDGCTKDCLYERCGNKKKDTNEECDDGNKDNGDGCSACCKYEM